MTMIVDAFVSKFTEMLLQLAKEKVDTILGVKKQLQRLQEKLQLIQAVLSDAERRRIHDAAVNLWLSNLRDLMYDADDIIDLCKIKAHHLLSSSSSCFAMNTITNLPALFRCKIGAKIAKLNQRLDEINEDRKMFSLEPASSSSNVVTTQMDSRQTSPLSRSDVHVVGREIEDATNMLVESLVKTGGDHRLRVYIVVGLGGIGKTDACAESVQPSKTGT